MGDSENSYRQILRSTSVFGGVQVFNIVISVVRSKIIALLIGPAGIGLIGLFNAALNLVGSFTNAGLETSGVKTIAAAQADEAALAKEVSIFKRLIWMTGILGAALTAVLAPWLSKVSFGNHDYMVAFLLLSVSLLFKQLTTGNLVVLQALSRIKFLAKANLYGSLLGLIVSVPLYYYYGVAGIVPSILLSSFLLMILSFHYRNKERIKAVVLTNKEVLDEGKNLIVLGFSLSFIGLLTTLAAYLLQVFISHQGSVAEVGLYAAGFTILNSYVGVIFSAMATDYYPRLAKVSQDNASVARLVNEQAVVAMLLLTPIVVLFLALAPNVIRLLYSREFLPIVPMVCWGILGMIIKAVSWSMGYVFIAKGDSRMFITTSIVFNSLFLVTNMAGYYFYGLQGLGFTFLVNYIIHFLVLKAIAKKRYGLAFDNAFYRLFLYSLLICAVTFVSLMIEPRILMQLCLAILVLASFWFSWVQLNRRLDFRGFFSRKK